MSATLKASVQQLVEEIENEQEILLRLEESEDESSLISREYFLKKKR